MNAMLSLLQESQSPMKLTQAKIKNFKAISEATLELTDFTAIVGENGSGKSSVLQALHWVFQSGRNRTVQPRAADNPVGSTLSEKDATYMPSPEYKNAGYGPEYGNKQGTSQLDLRIDAVSDNGEPIRANMWIKSARNEGLSVHVPANNEFVRAVRDYSREFSAYIPGLAGIPLKEEKRSELIVHRQAAAGDANTVFRNVLLLLKEEDIDGESGLDVVQKLASEVFGELKLNVKFDEARQTSIAAKFQTKEMRAVDVKRFKPLELAGIGFLQVIQIFAYLVYFRPVILLVDEPDSHLHPATQERLVRVLATAAAQYGAQVIVSTHSPSVVRALPADALVVWMKKGAVQPDGDTAGRQRMGWGLLDKRILLLSEDEKTKYLRALLSQWPDVERVTAIWPLQGTGKLPPAGGLASLQKVLGEGLKLVLHHDCDFMMPTEQQAFSQPYTDRGIVVWLTCHSDVEAYWADPATIASHFKISRADADALLKQAVAISQQNGTDHTIRNTKRTDIRNKIKDCKNGTIGAFNDGEVVAEYSRHGKQHIVLGKTLCKRIREQAKNAGYPSVNSFGNLIPEERYGSQAGDLRDLLRRLLRQRQATVTFEKV